MKQHANQLRRLQERAPLGTGPTRDDMDDDAVRPVPEHIAADIHREDFEVPASNHPEPF